MVTSANQTFELPLTAGSGKDKEVTVLLDEHHLKLVTIALRSGTSLTPHCAEVPVTIHVLEGEGTIHVGAKPVPVSRGSIVVLLAGEEHDAVPGRSGNILLLVHYLRSAQQKQPIVRGVRSSVLSFDEDNER